MVKKTPVTLRDVAQKAGVAASTVSRILNNKESTIPISDETRRRVIEAAREIGYKPNIAARNLVQQQSFALIGAIVPHTVPEVLSQPFYMMVLRGIAQQCQQNDYAVTIYFVNTDQEDKVATVYPRIANIPADGFILTMVKSSDKLIPRFLEGNIPFVQIGRPLLSAQWPTAQFVDVDNYLGASLAVEYLIQQGHRKIATIAAPQNMAAGVDRLKGYLDALQKAGLSTDPGWMHIGDFEPASGYAKMMKILDGPDRPTAVFVAGDGMTIGVYKALKERRLSIPKDIAVVGFDDNPESANSAPPLTTIRQPTIQLGERAAMLLLQMLSESPQKIDPILTPELIVRASA